VADGQLRRARSGVDGMECAELKGEWGSAPRCGEANDDGEARRGGSTEEIEAAAGA
jgi:hypothetical protein